MCPKGDDPLTDITDFRSIVITVSASRAIASGSLKFTFNDESLTIPVRGWTDSDCEDAFDALPNIGEVRCSIRAAGRFSSFSVLVEFQKWPIFPYENNIYTHEGDPPLSSFTCDTSAVVTTGSLTCTIADVQGTQYPGIHTPSHEPDAMQ